MSGNAEDKYGTEWYSYISMVIKILTDGVYCSDGSGLLSSIAPVKWDGFWPKDGLVSKEVYVWDNSLSGKSFKAGDEVVVSGKISMTYDKEVSDRPWYRISVGGDGCGCVESSSSSKSDSSHSHPSVPSSGSSYSSTSYSSSHSPSSSSESSSSESSPSESSSSDPSSSPGQSCDNCAEYGMLPYSFSGKTSSGEACYDFILVKGCMYPAKPGKHTVLDAVIGFQVTKAGKSCVDDIADFINLEVVCSDSEIPCTTTITQLGRFTKFRPEWQPSSDINPDDYEKIDSGLCLSKGDMIGFALKSTMELTETCQVASTNGVMRPGVWVSVTMK